MPPTVEPPTSLSSSPEAALTPEQPGCFRKTLDCLLFPIYRVWENLLSLLCYIYDCITCNGGRGTEAASPAPVVAAPRPVALCSEYCKRIRTIEILFACHGINSSYAIDVHAEMHALERECAEKGIQIQAFCRVVTRVDRVPQFIQIVVPSNRPFWDRVVMEDNKWTRDTNQPNYYYTWRTLSLPAH